MLATIARRGKRKVYATAHSPDENLPAQSDERQVTIRFIPFLFIGLANALCCVVRQNKPSKRQPKREADRKPQSPQVHLLLCLVLYYGCMQ